MDNQPKQSQSKLKKKVANFVIDFTKELGRGQFGKVYGALNTGNNQQVAVKIIEKKLIYQDDYTKNALIREIEIMKNLKSPNIIRFIDIQETANNIYIFQQLANGGTLSQMLKKTPHRRFQQKNAVQYAAQILTGFKQLITHGIIHRDIKLTNILMKDNQCKIADFGMSKYTGKLTSFSSVVGTPIYMAPQIMDFQEDQHAVYTYKCDIWSLGVLCYQLVTGIIPWKNIMNCQMTDLLNKIKQQCKTGIQFPKHVNISQEYKSFVRGCLKFNQQQRFDWNQIFKHKLFQGRFKQSTSGYQNFTLTQLRLKVHCNNVNLQKLVAKLPQNFTKQDLYHLLKVLDERISQKQAYNLFKAFAKQKNQVSKQTILQNLENHGIRLKGIKAKTDSKQQNILQILQQISQQIQKNQIDLFNLFKKFDTKKNNMLSKPQFGALLTSLCDGISNEGIQQMYQHFNPQNKRGIKFQYFYEKLCKAIQVPAVKDELTSKQIKKMQERNKVQ